MQNESSKLHVRQSGYQTNSWNPYHLHYRRLFSDLEKASTHAFGDLLDIGCGNKPYEKMFEGKIRTYTGCDVAQSDGNRVDVICLATELKFSDAAFDTVLCTQVIEHVADHLALLREAYRVLRPGGVLILSGPMYWPLHEEPYDFFRFTKHGLRYLLEKAGFTGIDLVANGGKWALCGQALIHGFEEINFRKKRITRLINQLFSYLDDKYPDSKNPMNYVVVARKP